MSAVFIIAEAGVNHNGDPQTALKMIEAAARSGADAVKFQVFRAENLVTREAPMAAYQSVNLGKPSSQYAMLKELELRDETLIALKQACDAQGILFMATPFDLDSVDLLEPLVDRYKISSGDLTFTPLLQKVASKKKPVILSTGMATLEEIRDAVEVVRDCPTTLLHCTTNYPCRWDEVNLRAIATLQTAFGLPVGYSDHTLGTDIPLAAVALGATVIEKHFTLSRGMRGPDHQASLELEELTRMVRSIRNLERAMGDGVKDPQPSEIENRKVARRSLIAARNLRKGEVLSATDITFKRPGTGISPRELETLIGRRLSRDVSQDSPFSYDMVES